MEVKIVKGKVLYFCKNTDFRINLIILMMYIHILLCILVFILIYFNISIVSKEDYKEWFLSLLIYPIIILTLRWAQNYNEPLTLTIYENGIEVPKQRHFFKKIFIPFYDIKTIYPYFRHDSKDNKPFEKKKIKFVGINIILKDNKEYMICDNKFKDNMKIAFILKNTIGEEWINKFDKHYEAKNLSNRDYNLLNYLNKKGKKAYNAPKRYTFKTFALAQLYDLAIGNNTLREKIGDINDKYKELWKNVEEIPEDFSW